MKNKVDNYKLYNGQIYDKYRPSYPSELIGFIVNSCKEKTTAWDCCTGTGFIASKLADHFEQVIATDRSDSQIESAMLRDNITYEVNDIYESKIEKNSIDLITVAQAYHWLDEDRFAEKCHYILKDSGILAITCYAKCEPSDIENVTRQYTKIINKEHLYKQEQLIYNEYADINLPFKKLESPSFHMRVHWNMHEYLAYLSTMSMRTHYQKQHGNDPLDLIHDELAQVWRDPHKKVDITWKVTLHLYQK